ncbi:MAG: DNA mismatch repair protein MutS [Myxococcales bacterium]|nr:DNA mismatch repair protein MutS [Myxococcales bacterium]
MASGSASSSSQTPLMRQYLDIKSQHPDAILFFRMGDFYEMFFDDAVVAAEALELTLTARDKHRDDPVPMAGVPHHAAKAYIGRLLEQGFRVAICDQVEDPKQAKGLVRRAVTRVVTPGVVLEPDHLDAKRNNYLVALTARSGSGAQARSARYGLAALDLSTFELEMTVVDGESGLADELARLSPKEVIYPSRSERRLQVVQKIVGGSWQAGGRACFASSEEDRELLERTASTTLEALGVARAPLAVGAAAAALRYAAETQPVTGVPRCRPTFYRVEDALQLDEATLGNLEIFESSMERTRAGSLLGVVDHTLTAMGGRLMRRCLARPLADVARIRRRQDAVEALVEQPQLRDALRQALRGIYDLERLATRVMLAAATPKELWRLGRSLAQLPDIAALLAEAGASTLGGERPQLLDWQSVDLLGDVAQALLAALAEDPPMTLRDGGIFAEGYDSKLDELVSLGRGGRDAIAAIEARERERTGITSLKIKHNKVFGYFIEVTKANIKSVPDDYHRKQTLANAERYVTPELADYEAKVLGADEKRVALEAQLFEALRERVAAEGPRLIRAAERVSMLDVLAALAEAAARFDYARPVVDDSDVVEIEEGRHAVVERFMPQGEFVANDVRLDEQQRMLVLTGPNMAGKSTVMRQVALTTILAQMGSFVPARRCRLGVADRLFTRVGASDNLARGESTFMVEMRETAAILRGASARSLVVLDEIGRGTSTYDGISIAWAVAEHLHDKVSCRTLFATHYHELCALADVKPRVANYTIDTQQWKGRVVFLRKLVPGGSNRSHGIEVARLAGLERTVVARAQRVLRALEDGEEVPGVPLRGRVDTAQLGLFAPAPARARGASSEVELALLAVDVERLTPIDALNTLAELVALARDELQSGEEA